MSLFEPKPRSHAGERDLKRCREWQFCSVFYAFETREGSLRGSTAGGPRQGLGCRTVDGIAVWTFSQVLVPFAGVFGARARRGPGPRRTNRPLRHVNYLELKAMEPSETFSLPQRT